MKNQEFEDLTILFLKLQDEIEPTGIGESTSLNAWLQIVESDLGHLFVNTQHLSNCLSAGGLTYEHAFLKKTEKWSSPRLSKLLKEYRSAQAIDETRLFAVLANFRPRMDDAYQHVVSIAELEANKANLKLRAFAKSCLRDMGDLIESCLFPFLRLRLKILEIGGKVNKTNRHIDDLSLGATIDEISPIDPVLYCPKPFKVSLSQWRNVSHHSSYKVLGGTIRCEYGKQRHRRQFECSQNQLLEMGKYVNNVYYLHKVANEIFCTDNVHALKKTIDRTNVKIELSEFTTDATMAYSIVAGGFRILNAARKDFKWILVLRDLHARRKEDIKSALQEALIPYLFCKGPAEINARVESRTDQHFISFRGELRKSNG